MVRHFEGPNGSSRACTFVDGSLIRELPTQVEAFPYFLVGRVLDAARAAPGGLRSTQGLSPAVQPPAVGTGNTPHPRRIYALWEGTCTGITQVGDR